MAVDLIDYVPSLKREVQPPGSTIFAGVTDSEWVGYLTDAFWEARMDGLLEGYVVEGYDPDDASDSTIAPTVLGRPDIDGKGMALVVLYAGIKVLRNRILNMSAGFTAKAGPVEFQQNGAAATVLAEMLKQLRATKDRILAELDGLGSTTHVTVLDAYSTRLFEPMSYYGSRELSG
ncbi:MAG: hypothetical protein HOV97_05080 [Nonomuraea sp.]|nr:hypothetical protein [Nonomuraea sp.]